MAPQQPEFDNDTPEDSSSLRLAIVTLWRSRQVIAGSAIGAALVFTLVASCLMLVSRSDRLATLKFQPRFGNGDRLLYPNGTPFDSGDVIATPVLSEVFEANDLQRFSSFQDFKNAVFVIESNPELDLLAYEYQARLSDAKLTAADRSRIEDEFQKKRKQIRGGYSLNLRRTERFGRMPRELMTKVLEDILATWARHAAERKGVLQYNVAALSRKGLRADALETDDYVVAVDALRLGILRALQNIDQIATLPGATVVRTGPERISLPEVRANLEDVYRFKVQTLVGVIRSTGLAKDRRLAVTYLENQRAQNRLDRNASVGNVRTLQASLRQYMREGRPDVSTRSAGEGASVPSAGPLPVPALIPQFGEAFLNRLTAMATENKDIEFRQDVTRRMIAEGLRAVALEKEVAYYDELIAALEQPPAHAADSLMAQRAADLVKSRAADARVDILRAVDQINGIYKDLWTHNLTPGTLLYTITTPFNMTTARKGSIRAVVLGALLVSLLAALITSVAYLAYSYFRREILEPSSPARTPRQGPPSSPSARRPLGSAAV